MLSGTETQALHRMVVDDRNFQHTAFWRQVALAASENPAVINAWHTSEHDLARRFHTDLTDLQKQLALLPSTDEAIWLDTVDAVNRVIDSCDVMGRRFEPQHKMVSGLAVAHVFYLCAAMQHALGFACTIFARDMLAAHAPDYIFAAGAGDELNLTIRLLTTSAENYRKSEMAFTATADIYTAILSFMDHVRRELAASSGARAQATRMADLFSALGRFLKVGPGVVQVRDYFGDAALTEEVTDSYETACEAVERTAELRRETDEALTKIAESNDPPAS